MRDARKWEVRNVLYNIRNTFKPGLSAFKLTRAEDSSELLS